MKRLHFLVLLLAVRLAAQNCDDSGVRIVEEREGETCKLSVETANCLDITVTLTAELENMRASPALPVTRDTHGRHRVELTTLTPRGAGQRWHYGFHYTWRYGGRSGQPDGTVYQLPFAAAAHHQLIQGYRGAFSHRAGSPNEYAHDWDLAEGSRVLAARAGVVVGIRQDSTVHGIGDQFMNCANYVIVRHTDGTYGEYLHLKPHGVLVKLGEVVAAGQPLALSGNTGYSSRPHLHFAVFRTLDGGTRETLPVKFRTKEGNAESLLQGKTY